MFKLFSRKAGPEVQSLEDNIASLTVQLAVLEGRKSVEEQVEKLEGDITRLASEKELAQAAQKDAEKSLEKSEKALRGVQAEHKIAEEDTLHLIKMTDETAELAKERYELKADAAADKKIGDAKDVYRNKLEAVLQKQIDDGKDLVAQVLKQLPTMTVKQKQ